MHEIGVLCQAVKEVDRIAAENSIPHVDGIVLEIGELTGMLPYFFEEYYDMVTDDFPRLRGSQLMIDTVPGIGKCQDCGTEYNVAQQEGMCPKCGSRRKTILSGMKFMIKDIVIYEEESA